MATVKETISRLEVHEKECLLRYRHIQDRLERGDARFDRLEMLLWGVYPFVLSVIALFKWMPQ
mgnify:CR=1 FL=1